jgi:2,4-diaminopentanoate dehydrogenase
MTYRVIVWSTGNVGRKAIAGVVAHPELELVGVWTSTESKEGQDAGSLAGLDGDLGVTATRDVDALLALEPDVVVYTAMADNRLMEAVEDLARILRAGIDVVSSSPVFLQFPAGLPDDLVAPVRDACEAGAASLFVNGIDPGWANDALPLALTSICERIDELRCMEVVNYATYDNALVLFDVMGFGKPLDETPLLLMPGVLTLAWGSVVRQLAAGLGVELDEIRRGPRTGRGARGNRDRVRHRGQGDHGGAAVRGPGHDQRPAPDRARARHAAAGRPRPALAPADRRRRLPGRRDRVAVVHARHADDGRGRRPQHRRPAGHRHAAHHRDPRGGRSPPGIVTALDLPPTTGRGLLNTAP